VSNILKYKSEIEKLKSVSEYDAVNDNYSNVTVYNTLTWRLLNSNLKSQVEHLENKPLNRKEVLEYYSRYFLNESMDASLPFLVTMLWGFGSNGYGAYRTNNYLVSEDNVKLINRSFEELKLQNIKEAYDLLMQIKGLNISYVSKVLYFATKALGIENYTLIFDIRVARALVEIEAGKEICSILNITPSDKYVDYVKYNNLIHKMAKELETAADSLEMFLFLEGGK
jgi:hypothetical protein